MSGGTYEVWLRAPREADETYQVWYLPVYLRPSGCGTHQSILDHLIIVPHLNTQSTTHTPFIYNRKQPNNSYDTHLGLVRAAPAICSKDQSLKFLLGRPWI